VFGFLFAVSCKNDQGNQSTTPINVQQDVKGTQVNSATVIEPPVMGGPAKITINVEGIAIPTSDLVGFYEESNIKIGTANVQNNQIIFENPDGYPQGIYYFTIAPNQYGQMMLSEDQEFELSLNISDVINSTEVKGSVENEVFYENLKFERDFNQKYKSVNAQLTASGQGTPDYEKSLQEKQNLDAQRQEHLRGIFKKHPNLLFTKFKKAGQNPQIREDVAEEDKVYYYREAFWNDVDFSDRRLLRTPVIKNKINRYFKEITPQKHDSIIISAQRLINKVLTYPEYYRYFANWPMVNYEVGKSELMDTEALFVTLSNEYINKDRAFWLDTMQVYAIQNRAMEMGRSLMGQKGINISVPGVDRKLKTLFDSKAEYLVVYLYTPTCENCKEETPQLVEWYNENKGGRGDVFAIATATNMDEWKNYIKDNNMTFTNAYDPSNKSIYATYFVDHTPEIYLLNKDRIIIGKNLKTFQIDQMITIHEKQNK